MSFCNQCGSKLEENAVFCPHCGNARDCLQNGVPSEKNASNVLLRRSRVWVGVLAVVVVAVIATISLFAFAGTHVQGDIAGTYEISTPDLELQLDLKPDGTVGAGGLPGGGKFLGVGVRDWTPVVEGLRWEKIETPVSEESGEHYRITFDGDAQDAVSADEWKALQDAGIDFNRCLRETSVTFVVPEGFPQTVEGEWIFSVEPSSFFSDAGLPEKAAIAFRLKADGNVDATLWLGANDDPPRESVSNTIQWMRRDGEADGKAKITVQFSSMVETWTSDVATIVFNPAS